MRLGRVLQHQHRRPVDSLRRRRWNDAGDFTTGNAALRSIPDRLVQWHVADHAEHHCQYDGVRRHPDGPMRLSHTDVGGEMLRLLCLLPTTDRDVQRTLLHGLARSEETRTVFESLLGFFPMKICKLLCGTRTSPTIRASRALARRARPVRSEDRSIPARKWFD